MRFYLFIHLVFFFSNNNFSAAQAPAIEWQRCYGGSQYDISRGNNAIHQTADGGFIFSGTTSSFDGDVSPIHVGGLWIVKTNSVGNIEWQKSYGGSGAESQYSKVLSVPGGGYCFAVTTYSNDHDVSGNHGGDDIWLGKIDSVGNLLWQKCYGGSGNDEFYSIEVTRDSGFIITGSTFSNDYDVSGNHDTTGAMEDVWVIKIDSVGNLQWQKCLGGMNTEIGMSVKQATDSGYIVVGWTQEPWDNGDVFGVHGSADIWVVKLSKSGQLQWQKCLGGSFVDQGYSVIEINDGSYLVAGTSGSTDGDVVNNHGDFEYWVIQLDSLGNIQWKNSYGGSNGEEAFALNKATDGGYVLAGFTASFDGEITGLHGDTVFPLIHTDYWVIKIDSIGNLEWQKCLGGAGEDVACAVVSTIDSGIAVLGYTVSSDGDITYNHGLIDMWVVKLTPYIDNISFFEDQLSNLSIGFHQEPNELILNFEYTRNESLTIELFDPIGCSIMDKKAMVYLGSNQLNIETPELSPGIYVAVISGEKKRYAKKFLIY